MSESHVSDVELVCIIDNEAVEPAVASHIALCSSCTARIGTLRSRLDRLSVVLDETDAVARDAAPTVTLDMLKARASARKLARARRFPPWLSAAAGVLLCVGVAAAAVPSLRSWISGQWSAVITHPTRAPRPVATQTTDASTIVSFVPEEGDQFVIRFDAVPAAGVLDVTSADGRASAEIVRGGANDELVVLPGELRIRNSSASTADYRITLPCTVHSLHIEFEDQPSSRGRVVAMSHTTHQTIKLGM